MKLTPFKSIFREAHSNAADTREAALANAADAPIDDATTDGWLKIASAGILRRLSAPGYAPSGRPFHPLQRTLLLAPSRRLICLGFSRLAKPFQTLIRVLEMSLNRQDLAQNLAVFYHSPADIYQIACGIT
jgi:hypothetical protein